MRAFVVLGLVFSMPSQESGLGKRLRNDLCCVEWDVKPQLNQSVCNSASIISTELAVAVTQQMTLAPATATLCPRP